MERILEELYNGSICPAENRSCDDPEYEGLCRESLKETDAFAKGLGKEQREAFDAMMENYLELCYMEKTQAFCDGFRLGAQMMCAVFCQDGSRRSGAFR